ncbi:hypothetical protein RI367_005021 [Sorochytrium milnesiophthora]
MPKSRSTQRSINQSHSSSDEHEEEQSRSSQQKSRSRSASPPLAMATAKHDDHHPHTRRIVLSSMLLSVLAVFLALPWMLAVTQGMLLSLAAHFHHNQHHPFPHTVYQHPQQQQSDVAQPLVPSTAAPHGRQMAAREVEYIASPEVAHATNLASQAPDKPARAAKRPGECVHEYEVIVLSYAPFVAYVRNFLQPGEADHVRNLTAGRMHRSTVTSTPAEVDEKQEEEAAAAEGSNSTATTAKKPAVKYVAKTEESQDRTSFSSFLRNSETPEVVCIEQRAARLQGLDTLGPIEALQVVWYRRGQKFSPHHDWFWDTQTAELATAGQRTSTILVYLNSQNDAADVDPQGEQLQGGDTVFPRLSPPRHLCGHLLNCDLHGLRVKPRKGDAVWWRNTAPDARQSFVGDSEVYTHLHGDELTLHGGEPVDAGEKYAINIWTRERDYRQSGERPAVEY